MVLVVAVVCLFLYLSDKKKVLLQNYSKKEEFYLHKNTFTIILKPLYVVPRNLHQNSFDWDRKETKTRKWKIGLIQQCHFFRTYKMKITFFKTLFVIQCLGKGIGLSVVIPPNITERAYQPPSWPRPNLPRTTDFPLHSFSGHSLSPVKWSADTPGPTRNLGFLN